MQRNQTEEAWNSKPEYLRKTAKEIAPRVQVDISTHLVLPAAASSPPTEKRFRILVVDDDESNIDLLVDIFEEDYEVFSAADGLAALEIAAITRPDLILLDVVMPGIDGYEVCERLKAEPLTSDCLVLFITGLGNAEDETRGLELGAVDYVTKPITVATVRARVDSHLRFKRVQQQLLALTAKQHAAQLAAEMKRSEEMDRMRRYELQQKDEFISHVSHELRSPLTSIYSFTTIVADGLAGKTNAKQGEYLKIILKNVEQLQTMIEDLLEVTRTRSGKLSLQLQNVPVAEAVGYALRTLEVTARSKDISLAFDNPNKRFSVLADPLRLRQILIILIDNAIKFTHKGGNVRIRVGLDAKDPRSLLMEVSDNGCGIDAEMIERVFEHMYQVNSSDHAGRTGLGLGLHIAKELVTQHGGKIWVNSASFKGSTFSFTLPLDTSS